MSKAIKIILGVFLFGAIALASTPTTFRTDILQFGRSATGDKILQFFRGPSVFTPGFKWNETTASLQFTNDGSTYTDIAGANIFRNYIDGFQATWVSTTSISFTQGVAYDSTNTQFLTLASTFTKTTSAWASGSGVGGLDTGSITPSAFYYFYVIKNPTSNTTDLIFSLSASSPSLPSGYTLYRRVFSMFTTGSSTWAVFTHDGEEVVLDGGCDAYAGAVAAFNSDQRLACTPGHNAIIWGYVSSANNVDNSDWTAVTFTHAGLSVPTPVLIASAAFVVARAASGSRRVAGTDGSANGAPTFFRIQSNSSGNIRLYNRIGDILYVTVMGWTDRRGKL